MKHFSLGCFVIIATWLASTATAQQVEGYELALADLRGHRTVLGTLPGTVFAPRVSPDGKSVAFELADLGADGKPAARRLYVAPIADLSQRRALPQVGSGNNWAAVWSTDGAHLAFLVNGDRPDTIFWRRADGRDEARPLTEGRAAEGIYAGDRTLSFLTLTTPGDYGIALMDLPTQTVTLRIDREGSAQHSARISPDGNWIAYSSDESGRQEVWLARLGRPELRYRITQDGGRHPLWSRDGSTLYFDQAGQMFRIELFLGAEVPKAGKPKGLPIRGFQQGDLRRQFDLMPDGKRFLMLFPRGAAAP